MRRATRQRLAAALAVVAVGAVPFAVRPAHAARHAGPLGVVRVGAARADITPPRSGGVPDAGAPGCHEVDGSGPFDGHRAFGLEEPYADVNGNGHYDAPDPTTGSPGEPFLDCPTPTALGGVRPPDGRWDGIYLGGGSCCDRLADGTVFDPIEADALVVSDGVHRIAVVTADNEGVFKEIWDEVRAKVAADGVHLDAVFPSSTHDESAPDTIGITGPTQTTSAVDPFYVEFFVSRVAAAIERAATHLRPARLRYGSITPDDLVPCWSSYPFVADESVGAMQAVSTHGHRVLATLVNYGIHAEDLGFDPKTQHDLSADWWHFLRSAIRSRYGAAPVLSMAGLVGSVEMPMILSGPRDRQPTGTHQYSSRDGCTTIYSGPPQLVEHESGYATYTRTLGHVVARWAERALRRGAWSRSGRVGFAQRTIRLPVTNLLFLAAAPACVFDYRLFYVNGVQTGTGTPPVCGAGNEILTDVGYFRLGDGSFVTAPGEVFPFTYAHDFHGAADLPDPSAGPVHGWVLARLGGRWRFVDGLGEDLSGYIFAANNEVGTPTAANPTGNDVDRFGCHHVDDAEASSGQEGDIVDDALMALLPRSRDDHVVAGRYVWSDGSLHRDPTGSGRHGCDAASAVFTPAPDGGAVGVWVLPRGVTTFRPGVGHLYLLRPSRLGPVTAGVHWIDLNGRRQGTPTQQTRGIVLPGGRRLWLDVYPDLDTDAVRG